MDQSRIAIRDVVDSWAVARDAGMWVTLRQAWHEDGRMNATWFRGSADAFVAASRAGFDHGVMVHHFLGGSAIDVASTRAIAQTKMSISQRLTLDGVEVDVTCVGRFYDFFERRDGVWRMVLREPIYEKDRLDPVSGDRRPRIDGDQRDRLPYGCRHLLLCQIASGMEVFTDVPQLRGAKVEELYADGRRWLEGGALRV